MTGDVVAVLTYRTWAAGVEDDHTQQGQAIVKRLVADVHGQPPTLESAFMAYTGRSLDEDVEEDGSGDD